MRKKRNNIKPAKQSLVEILRRIEPFMPKTPKIKEEKPRTWKIVSNGTLPPLNSMGCD